MNVVILRFNNDDGGDNSNVELPLICVTLGCRDELPKLTQGISNARNTAGQGTTETGKLGEDK